jgi:hypothetical protein
MKCDLVLDWKEMHMFVIPSPSKKATMIYDSHFAESSHGLRLYEQ